MCGIAGYVLRDGRAERDLVKGMCDVIRHRGPDDDGYLISGPCALGIRRLSIIDLELGHQPIGNEDESLWIVFNGEIYNYRELRRRLSSLGHVFKTSSDTEVLLHCYEEWGPEGFQHLRGMFAVAIWDEHEQELVLARDRFGKKPLYYALTDRGCYFGSELKCLRPADVPRELDDEALRLYLQFSYIPDPRSPFRAIRKLTPGSWMIYRADGSHREGRYWTAPRPAEAAAGGLSEQESSKRIEDTFDEAVRLRMIADVPLGAFLSGGIDSSLVVASMVRQSAAPVKTFAIGFEEQEFNELPYAAVVAKKYNTQHHEIVLHPDCIDVVNKVVDHCDEPFGDSSAIPTYLVSEFAAQHIKVALSGDGGDELFAGYESFAAVDRLRVVDAVPKPVRALVGHAADYLPYSAYGKNFLRMVSRPSALERYFELNYTPYFLRKQLVMPGWLTNGSERELRAAFGDSLLPNGADMVSQALYFETTAKLTGDMLVKVDRMSMAASLEVRCPMLDHELAEVAARIPYPWNLRNRTGKRMLIKSMGDRLPREILERKKKGFGVPLSIWFRSSLRSFLWEHLTARSFLDRGIVRGEFVRHLLQEHDAGRRDNSHWLWMLLMLELWFRKWLDA